MAKEWSDAAVHIDTYKAVERVYSRLLGLNFITDENDKPAPVDIPLSPEAKRLWIEFYDEHAAVMEGATGRLASAYAKLEGYAARLALILYFVKAVASGGWTTARSRTVDAESLAAGVTLAKWFCHEVERTYQMIGESDTETETRLVVELIERRGGRITANDLRRRSRDFPTTEEAEQFLEGLVSAGRGRWGDIASTPEGGRPTRYFRLTEGASVSETQKRSGETEVSDTETGRQVS